MKNVDEECPLEGEKVLTKTFDLPSQIPPVSDACCMIYFPILTGLLICNDLIGEVQRSRRCVYRGGRSCYLLNRRSWILGCWCRTGSNKYILSETLSREEIACISASVLNLLGEAGSWKIRTSQGLPINIDEIIDRIDLGLFQHRGAFWFVTSRGHICFCETTRDPDLKKCSRSRVGGKGRTPRKLLLRQLDEGFFLDRKWMLMLMKAFRYGVLTTKFIIEKNSYSFKFAIPMSENFRSSS